ncbi:MAG: dihydroxyacetone kinase subunit L [Candidatus Accumulibacter sp.]|nr:dihydroxyacetone kinase subunit L [Accumulibacter sp.]
MKVASLKAVVASISKTITGNRDYLVQLDQQNGDGDLGISMSDGFKAIDGYLQTAEETDLGKLFFQMSKIFNEKAPSSLGTILSFGLMGMARALKGKETAGLAEVVSAFRQGIDLIMEKAGSKPGEKTILDALCPALEALQAHAATGNKKEAFAMAATAAAKGSESTRQMLPKHGRAVYYGEKSLGVLDGGSVVGRLIFEAISEYCNTRNE